MKTQDWFEESEASTDTIKTLDAFCAQLIDAREKADRAKEELSICNQDVDALEKKIIAILEEHKKPNWDFGGKKFSVTTRMAVTLPKDPEAKAAFYAHLKEKGIFEELVSVNYQTLNGYFKSEMEQALENGQVDFTLPGVGSPTYSSGITIRKGK